MQTFHKLLGYALIAATTNNFVWFALTYWAYLETRNVVATGIVAGVYLVAVALSAFWLGSIVDHHKKKSVMLGSSAASLCMFSLGLLLYTLSPEGAFTTVLSPYLWGMILILLGGTLAGNLLNIAIPTLVTHLVPEEHRDKANGLFGTVMGISFAITSVASGISLAFGGMTFVLAAAIVTTMIAIVFLSTIKIPEKDIIHVEGAAPQKVDIKGTLKVVQGIPGLLPLIFFSTFNNFLGGVFMALMDAYGLSLVSVEVWGFIWGGLSFGFILGGLWIAKRGLGKDPVFNLFRINIITWTVCIFFTIQPSIILLIIGSLIWMILVPFVEATEQTIIQKVVPPERQGRVFGFAQSIEQAASPVTAFLIGPIAQYLFIPFMTTGAGVQLLGDWYGTGVGRGIGLVFSIAGIIGLLMTLIAMRSNAYKKLAKRFAE